MLVGRFARLILLVLTLGFGIGTWAESGLAEFVPGQVIVKLKGHQLGQGVSFQAQKMVSEKFSSKAQLKQSFQKMGLQHYQLKPNQDMQAVMNEMAADSNIEYVEPNYILHKTVDREQLEAQLLQQMFSSFPMAVVPVPNMKAVQRLGSRIPGAS